MKFPGQLRQQEGRRLAGGNITPPGTPAAAKRSTEASAEYRDQIKEDVRQIMCKHPHASMKEINKELIKQRDPIAEHEKKHAIREAPL